MPFADPDVRRQRDRERKRRKATKSGAESVDSLAKGEGKTTPALPTDADGSLSEDPRAWAKLLAAEGLTLKRKPAQLGDHDLAVEDFDDWGATVSGGGRVKRRKNGRWK